MLASDVVSRVRSTFGDKDSAQIQDVDFLRWINDAQREIAAKFEFSQTKGVHDLMAGEAEYKLPDDVYKIYSVLVGGTPLTWISPQEGMSKSGTGNATNYWVWDRVLTLSPAPTTGKVGGLVIYYLAMPTSVISLDQELSVPTEYHLRVADFCLAQAYLIDNDREGYTLIMSKMSSDFPTFYNDRTGDSTAVYPSIGSGDGYE